GTDRDRMGRGCGRLHRAARTGGGLTLSVGCRTGLSPEPSAFAAPCGTALAGMLVFAGPFPSALAGGRGLEIGRAFGWRAGCTGRLARNCHVGNIEAPTTPGRKPTRILL